MPHIIIEYTENAVSATGVMPLLAVVHDTVMTCGLFEPSHVKTRAVPLAYYRTGTDNRPFVHVQLRIKPGRTGQQKRALSAAVLAAMHKLPLAARVVTVEVVEMDADSYAKYEA